MLGSYFDKEKVTLIAEPGVSLISRAATFETEVLDVKDILYIDTADKKTFLYTEKQVFQSALRLYELEDTLKELDFFRAGRSTILNFRRVRSVRPELGRRWLVTMDNNEQIWVSRQYAGELKEKLQQAERSIFK